MPLPAPQARTHLHTRATVYRGYRRDDGLWDIEGELSDTKTYSFELHGRPALTPGEPIHGMAIRATLDDSMTIREIVTVMDDTPYGECQQGTGPMQKMVGEAMGPGWRMAIERALGGTRGCTHLRELLFNMATAAYQTIPGYRSHLRKQSGSNEEQTAATTAPYHLGKCIAWDFNGAVVQRNYPQFAGLQPIKRSL